MSIPGKKDDAEAILREMESSIVETLQKEEYSLNTVNSYGENLFHVGVANGCLNIAKEVLTKNKNYNIDQKNKFGWTPLMHAIRYGNIDMVKFLLKNGSSINESTYLGVSVLSLAAAISEEMFDLVLSACPSILENADNDDMSPLCIAAMRNDKKLFFKLLSLGSDVSKANEYTHLMMRQSTVPEIAALAKTHLDIEDYWSDCSDNIKVEKEPEGTTKNDFRQLRDITNRKKESPKIVVDSLKPHADQSNESGKKQAKNLKLRQKPLPLDLLNVINEGQHYQNSLISPNLMYCRDEGFPVSPNIYYSKSEYWGNIEETRNDDITAEALNRSKENATATVKKVNSSPALLINSSQNTESLDAENIDNDNPNLTLSFTPEFSPPKSPNLPADFNDEDTVFGENTPTPPHCKTPPRGMVLNSQQTKLVLLLKSFGLGNHVSIFLEQEVDLELFLTLNDNDLEEIGIKHKAEREALLQVIKECRNIEI